MTPEILEDRLIQFGVGVCRLLRRLSKDLVSAQLGRQVVRSATSPAANYAEARAAESHRDFVHKLSIGAKELRETGVWLQFIDRLEPNAPAAELIDECEQLTSIFVSSIKTARSRQSRR